MNVDVQRISSRLLAMLHEQNDDGTAPLRVSWHRGVLCVRRCDGSELSASERAHVAAILAARTKGTPS